MHSIQHPQIDQSHYNIPSFLLSRHQSILLKNFVVHITNDYRQGGSKVRTKNDDGMTRPFSEEIKVHFSTVSWSIDYFEGMYLRSCSVDNNCKRLICSRNNDTTIISRDYN